MKALKKIITTKEIDLQLGWIELLTREKYEDNKDIIPSVNTIWWLKTYGVGKCRGSVVYPNGDIGLFQFVRESFGVRPVLHIRHFESTGLERGDKIELAGYSWTIITENSALCDSIVGKTSFQTKLGYEGAQRYIYDPLQMHANDYDHSEIKDWVLNWARENNFTFVDNYGCVIFE